MAGRIDPEHERGVLREVWARLDTTFLSVALATILLLVPSVYEEITREYPRGKTPGFWDRAGEALTPNLFGVLFAGVFLGLYVLTVVPVRQRNSARGALRDAVAEASPTRTLPDLLIDPTPMGFNVTNRGEPDNFQVQVTVGDGRPDYLEWGRDERVKWLVTGAFAKTSHLPRVDFTASFLSDNHLPLVRRYDFRETTLGVPQVKDAENDWPVRDENWFGEIATLFSQLSNIQAALDRLRYDDAVNAKHIMNEDATKILFHAGHLVGHSFVDRQYAVNRYLGRDAKQHVSDAEWVTGYRECVASWVRDLQDARDRKTDAPA